MPSATILEPVDEVADEEANYFSSKSPRAHNNAASIELVDSEVQIFDGENNNGDDGGVEHQTELNYVSKVVPGAKVSSNLLAKMSLHSIDECEDADGVHGAAEEETKKEGQQPTTHPHYVNPSQ